MNNVAVFGEETAAHPSVSQEQKKNIEQSIVTIKNEWDRLNEKINWRLARYVVFILLGMHGFVYRSNNMHNCHNTGHIKRVKVLHVFKL